MLEKNVATFDNSNILLTVEYPFNLYCNFLNAQPAATTIDSNSGYTFLLPISIFLNTSVFPDKPVEFLVFRGSITATSGCSV